MKRLIPARLGAMYIIAFLFLSGSINLLAQQSSTITLELLPQYDHAQFQLATYYKLNKKDSIEVEMLRFYISGIELQNHGKVVWKEENGFHLVDAEISNSLSVQLHPPTSFFYDQLRFKIGIDSAVNVSGAMPGDLDPTKGMYWTWQSGYINMKVEGKSNLCKNPRTEFQFHLGGYQYPFGTCQSITLEVEKREKIVLAIDIEKLISRIDLSNMDHVMTPGADAKVLSEKLPRLFSIVK